MPLRPDASELTNSTLPAARAAIRVCRRSAAIRLGSKPACTFGRRLRRPATATLLAASLFCCGPYDPSNPSMPGSPTPSPTVTIHPAPTPVSGDPLSGLPETKAKGRLLVSSVSEKRPLQLLDLSAGRTFSISGIPGGGLQLGAFTPDGGVAFVAGPRSVGYLDPAGVRRPDSILSETTPGNIKSLTVVGDAVVVSTGVGEPGRQTDGRSVVLEADGRIRCEGPEGTLLGWFRAGSLWSLDLRNPVGPHDLCHVRRPGPERLRRTPFFSNRGVRRLSHH